MIPLKNKGLEEMAVLFFLDKENTAKAFGAHLNTQNIKVTIQGVYKALNKLIEEGVLIKNKKKYVVSREWAESLIEKLGGTNKDLEMSEGEIATHQFTSLNQLDAYWKHRISTILLAFSNYPMFSYETHSIWVYLSDRKESEEKFFKSFEKNNRFAFFRVGGTTFGDKQYRQKYSGEYLKIDISDKRILGNHISIVGDYIVTTKLEKGIEKQIDDIFSEKDNEKDIHEGLEKILSKKQKVKLSIERNKEKAKKFRKKISENFYVPQELIKKYDLY